MSTQNMMMTGSDERRSSSSPTASTSNNNNDGSDSAAKDATSSARTTTTTTSSATTTMMSSKNQKRRAKQIESKREKARNEVLETEAWESNNKSQYLMSESKTPARVWLYDRIYGKSKINSESRPPCCCCWVPPPVGFCPKFTEENLLCRCWGKLGLIQPTNERARYWILHIGFWANVIGFILTFVSAFAISTNYDILKSTSFSRTILTGRNITKTQEILKRDYILKVDVGLSGVGFDLPRISPNNDTNTSLNNEDSVLTKYANETNFVVDFSEFCNFPSQSFISHMDTLSETTGEQQCTACGEVSNSMVITVIMSTITFIPSFFTDILRMYSNYDVNCQKAFATIFATLTLLLSINTLLTYNNACFASFYEGFVPLTAALEVPDDPAEAILNVHFDWKMGPGLACLYAGTILKIVDIIANLMVPTPTITRSNKEKWDYEQLSPYPPYDNNHNNREDNDEEDEEKQVNNDDDDEVVTKKDERMKRRHPPEGGGRP